MIFMTCEIRDLSKYSMEDVEKTDLISDVFKTYVLPELICEEYRSIGDFKLTDTVELYAIESDVEFTKVCPKCGEKYPDSENVCFDCLVHLKNISDSVDVFDIEFNPHFIVEGSDSYDGFENLLCADNLAKIKEFRFNHQDYLDVLHNIKSQAFRNFDDLVKNNEIDFDELNIADKIILFAKSFVKVKYKSSGGQLGYFEDNTIYIDDRQTKSLQITTMIHELSHFLIQEILSEILCKLLDCNKNRFIEEVVIFILSYTPFTQLIDEYAAHNVEGRFTLFGFQDYSSYKQIEASLNGEMDGDEIEITKSIGNTFSLSIKDILESLIDRDLREEIKDQFLADTLDKPNYDALKMENCQILNDEGFIKALWLILNDGCETASLNYIQEV